MSDLDRMEPRLNESYPQIEFDFLDGAGHLTRGWTPYDKPGADETRNFLLLGILNELKKLNEILTKK